MHNKELQPSTTSKMVNNKWLYRCDKKKPSQHQKTTRIKPVIVGLLVQVKIVGQILFTIS